MASEYEIKKQICDIGKRIYGQGMVAANDGNISVKLNDHEFLCTPTGVSKGFINSETENTNLSLILKLRASLVWNNKEWFAGVIGNIESAIIDDRKTIFIGNSSWLTMAVGYRFNLW